MDTEEHKGNDSPGTSGRSTNADADSGRSRIAERDVSDVLNELEADSSPKDEHHFYKPFRQLMRAFEERELEHPFEVTAEAVAFQVHAHDRRPVSSWGIYYGPMLSGVTDDGEQWESPSLRLITPDVLEYWAQRARTTSHPVMRARYADLLWEMPKVLDHSNSDAEMARIAIDSYLECISQRRYEHDVTLVGKAQRALEISLSIRDDERVTRCKDALLTLEDQLAKDEHPGLWGFSFDTLLEPPHTHIDLKPEETEKLVQDMEDRLTRFAAGPANEYHPAGAESAALRLANYYRRRGKQEEMRRVLRTYGVVVDRMRGTAAPLVTSHSLEELYNQFKAYEMHDDADRLNDAIRQASEEALTDLKPIEAEVEIPREKVEQFFSEILSGDAETVIHRIALHFVPSRENTENQVRRLAKDAPLTYLMTHTILDEEGRTVATIGPLENDLEGHVIRQLAQNLQFGIPWLREAFQRGLENHVFSESDVLEHLLGAPLFPPNRHAIIRAGVAAYCSGDSLAAVHVLVPQIEQALRQLALLMGTAIYTQRRGGGLHARTLDDLLRDDALEGVLGEDVTTYLRVLLSDARGWNIRNNVCHGLASVGMMTMPVADRILHALLVLGLVRETDE